jgi:hypothetical protein
MSSVGATTPASAKQAGKSVATRSRGERKD